MIVDASYRARLAVIVAMTVATPGARDGYEFLREVEGCETSNEAECRAARRAAERIVEFGWPAGVLMADTDAAVCVADSLLPEGWRAECVLRSVVQPAHAQALKTLRELRVGR